MKQFLLAIIALVMPAITFASDGASDTYTPLLQEGKTWKYTGIMLHGLIWPEWRPDVPREKDITIKIEGTQMMDGEEYSCVNAYYNGEPYEQNPIFWLREEIAQGKVWLYISEFASDFVYAFHYFESDLIVLYDFCNPTECYAVDSEYFLGDSEVECADGIRHAYMFKDYQNSVEYAMIDGIGLVSLDNTNIENHACDLLGQAINMVPCFPCGYLWPELYEVVDGDGTVIYHNANWGPGCTAMMDVKNSTDIKIGQDMIEISVAHDVDVRIADTQGRVMANAMTSAGELKLPTSQLPTGIYILTLGDIHRKFVKK